MTQGPLECEGKLASPPCISGSFGACFLLSCFFPFHIRKHLYSTHALTLPWGPFWETSNSNASPALCNHLHSYCLVKQAFALGGVAPWPPDGSGNSCTMLIILPMILKLKEGLCFLPRQGGHKMPPSQNTKQSVKSRRLPLKAPNPSLGS